MESIPVEVRRAGKLEGDVPQGYKRCCSCKEIKPAGTTDFARKARNPDGLQYACKVCLNTLAVNRRKPHWKVKRVSETEGLKRCIKCLMDKPATVEHFTFQSRKEELSGRCRVCEYEARNVRRRLVYATNPERRDYLRATKSLQRALNPVPHRQNAKRRKARLKGAEGTYTAAEWKKKLASYKGKCHWCGKHAGEKPHADHLIALNRGGTNYINNVVPSCEACNCSKQDKLPHEWTNRLL